MAATINLKRWWNRNWLRTRHTWKITNHKNIDRTRKIDGIRWRFSGMRRTFIVKGRLIEVDICTNKIAVKRRRKTLVSFLGSRKP